jgi:hypothetical protein
MQRLIDSTGRDGAPRVIRWCLMEVLERCPPRRDCPTCPLWDDCRGVAKTRCDGFVSIDDAIALKRRVSADTWAAEMLCRRPSTHGCVFPTFDPSVHVREEIGEPAVRGPGRAGGADAPHPSPLYLAIDFGFANPFVCLWIRAAGTADDGTVHVIDEYVQPQRTLIEHLLQIQSKGYGTVKWVACDPAGAARSEQTGESSVAVLRRAGFRVRHRRSRVVDGLEEIRTALRPAAESTVGAPAGGRAGLIPPPRPRLFIHPRCRRLIRAMQAYRYATDDGGRASCR